VCGRPGSGRSPLSRKLEVERQALLLTPDDGIVSLHDGDGQDADHPGRLEKLLLDLALRSLVLAPALVSDTGFWSGEARDIYRVGAAAGDARRQSAARRLGGETGRYRRLDAGVRTLRGG
jgi:predicted kinase